MCGYPFAPAKGTAGVGDSPEARPRVGYSLGTSSLWRHSPGPRSVCDIPREQVPCATFPGTWRPFAVVRQLPSGHGRARLGRHPSAKVSRSLNRAHHEGTLFGSRPRPALDPTFATLRLVRALCTGRWSGGWSRRSLLLLVRSSISKKRRAPRWL